MIHTEAGAQLRCHIVQEAVGSGPLGHHEMRGQRGFGGGHRPDVEIVHRGHTFQPAKMAAYLVKVDAGRRGQQAHRHAVPRKAPCAPRNHRDNQQADRRVDPDKTPSAGLPPRPAPRPMRPAHRRPCGERLHGY